MALGYPAKNSLPSSPRFVRAGFGRTDRTKSLQATAQPSLKFGGVLPAKLVYNQTGVCTPAEPSPGRAIGRRQKHGVGRLNFGNKKTVAK